MNRFDISTLFRTNYSGLYRKLPSVPHPQFNIVVNGIIKWDNVSFSQLKKFANANVCAAQYGCQFQQCIIKLFHYQWAEIVSLSCRSIGKPSLGGKLGDNGFQDDVGKTDMN
jgi:hypothetical protein